MVQPEPLNSAFLFVDVDANDMECLLVKGMSVDSFGTDARRKHSRMRAAQVRDSVFDDSRRIAIAIRNCCSEKDEPE